MTAAFDRGPAKYFHGRKQILHDFNELIERATQAKSGTTFLIQGAPGAGKSALLAECGKLAERRKWKVVDIPVRAIWSVDELRRTLGRGNIPVATRGSGQVGGGPIGKLEITVELASETMLKILQSGKDPLLLKLDEAQRIGTTVSRTNVDQFATATDVLYAIHNGELNRPVILITAGLGTTSDAFGALGISRFATGAFVELGALDKEAERAILYDWLTKDGDAKGNPTAWIDAIAQETHGWPQHILSYVKPSLEQLRADRRVMTAEGLNNVLKAGRAGRTAYYKQRARGFPEEERQSLARLFSDLPIGESVQLSTIMSSLTQNYGQKKAEALFRRAVEKGIIDERDGRYVIPVPSMQDWLVSNYDHIQEKELPSRLIGLSQEQRSTALATEKNLNQEIEAQSPGQLRDVEERNSGMDFGS